MEKKNREQRRRDKYGHAGGATKEPWPQSQANPVFSHGDAVDQATEATSGEAAAPAGASAPDAPPQTGSGTGGATKDSKRVIDRKETHSGDSAKG
jgi:hypothetical protein